MPVEDSKANGAQKVGKCVVMAIRGLWPGVETSILTLRQTKVYDDLEGRDPATGMNLMMLACRDSRRSVFEALIEFGFSVNERSNDGSTALHYATAATADLIVDVLLKHGVNTMVLGGFERRLALHIACQRPSSALIMVKMLLRYMPPKGRLVRDALGNLPLTYAVGISNDLLVRELLNEVPTEQVVEWAQVKTRNSLLHLATKKRDVRSAATLLEIGKADVNALNANGRTCLHLAAESANEKLVRLLAKYKANANILDRHGESPLHFAIRVGAYGIVCFMADQMNADVNIRKADGSTLMHLAAEYGYGKCINALHDRNVPLHMPNKAGILPLHLAAQHGYPDVVKVLLGLGAPINGRTKQKYTAMHLAVLHNRPLVIQLLMGCGASVDVQGGPEGELPLHAAARRNAVECAKMLLLTGAKVNAPTSRGGETALHMAARAGFVRLAELLLNEGADPHRVSTTGESPLHVAVRFCHSDMVRLLLRFVKSNNSKKDATKLVNVQTVEGETALHFGCGLVRRNLHSPMEDSDIVCMLLRYGADPTLSTKHTLEMPLHYAARVGNLNVTYELVEYMGHNFPPLANKQARNGWSPLLTACFYGHHDMVDLLTKNSARVDPFDEQGFSALHLAASNGFTACCELLLAKKAFINIKNKNSITPLHLAAANGHRELVKTLVQKYGAAVDVATTEKNTALHLAAENGHKDVARTLIDLKANINATDVLGQTALHLAAECDRPDVVQMFLKYKPELVYAANKDGMTCAHIAAAKGSVSVIKELMNFNKNVVVAARNKTTESLPLHLAAEGGHAEVLSILLSAGSPPLSENIDGMTFVHLIAKEGHIHLLSTLPQSISWKVPSVKNGLTPLHVAVFYSKVDMAREMLAKTSLNIPPDIPTEKASSYNISDETLKALIMIDVSRINLVLFVF